MQDLINRAITEHDAEPGASPEALAATEERLGFVLPEELRTLLSVANGIQFWSSGDYPCRLLSSDQLVEAHIALQSNESGPTSLIAILQVDSDFVAINVDSASEYYLKLVDCSHETFPDELLGVCDSLPELLMLVLNSSGNEWLWPAALEYGKDYSLL